MKRLLAILVLWALPARGADYMVIVLDASGSMANSLTNTTNPHSKMVVAKNALTQSLAHLRADYFGVVVFEDGRADPWVYPLGRFDRKQALRAIDLPQPNGSTPLGDYMKIGADVLLQARERNRNLGTYRLLVVTDGEADDKDQVAEYNRDIRSRGVLVSVIGVAMDSEHSLARQVDSYQNATDEASLARALVQVLAETPDTSDRPGDFVEGNLDPKVALVALEQLSTFHNQPVGEKPPVKTVDAAGNVTYLAAAPTSVGSGVTIVGVLVVVVLVGVGLVFLVRWLS